MKKCTINNCCYEKERCCLDCNEISTCSFESKCLVDLCNLYVGVEELEIEIFPEECCEDCGDIIHNHFTCPICKNNYASTNIYNMIELKDILICEECGSEFKLISESWHYECKVELIKKGKRND